MSAIQQIDAAARKHPQVVVRFLEMDRREREQHVKWLKQQLEECNRGDQIEDLRFVIAYIELETLSLLYH
ncbi:MAG: hypothetical protein A2854_00110 [Parcubacteria group bacterium RIFCSPHIGHO2_01_FULL_56_18]|nr:MAG: hypothetical protein A2854_00110 [Parcubacteria group bacterium RIFCSPHIGHO2_01_FULL_56_18]